MISQEAARQQGSSGLGWAALSWFPRGTWPKGLAEGSLRWDGLDLFHVVPALSGDRLGLIPMKKADL